MPWNLDGSPPLSRTGKGGCNIRSLQSKLNVRIVVTDLDDASLLAGNVLSCQRVSVTSLPETPGGTVHGFGDFPA